MNNFSKEAAYELGVRAALVDLGFITKEAAPSAKLRALAAAALEGRPAVKLVAPTRKLTLPKLRAAAKPAAKPAAKTVAAPEAAPAVVPAAVPAEALPASIVPERWLDIPGNRGLATIGAGAGGLGVGYVAGRN